MIIDFHTHCFPDKIAARAMRLLSQESGYPYYHDGSLAGLERSTRAAGIDCSVVMPIATRPEQTAQINRWAVKSRGSRTTFFGTLHPEYPEWRAEIRWLAGNGVRGIKMHPEYQQFFVDEPRYFPIYEEIFTSGLTILFHAGSDIAYKPPYHCLPQHLLNLVRAFPGGTVAAAHMGGYERWDEVEEMLIGLPLYLDTSFSIGPLGPERAVRMMRRHGTSRILFGSDAPWHDQAADLAEFRSLELDSDEQAAILGGNAAKLLGLAP